ncbi:MAG: molybdenum cofactor cytidylyltransferase [Paracoccaceae bacterium]|jgi:molybdenum cofactor cytidylyltransferase
MTILAILILAAGTSSRMGGRDKLLECANGTPLLAHVTNQAMATGLPVFITVPDKTHPRAALVATDHVTVIDIPDRLEGMAASIRTGAAALRQDNCALMILPGDMPDLQTSDLLSLANAHAQQPAKILRATSADGIPGHPVIFPADLVPDLMAVTGDAGARSVIEANKDRLQTYALPGNRAICDLDTPQDWAKWRERQPHAKNKKADR